MSLTIHVNGSSNSLAHKGSTGIAKSTIPDVCKTPSPGGPVPIPYPIIISMSSDLVKGSTTVKADGGNMIAIKDCELSKCTGDEPGTAGGVVSSTNMKEAKWILYSFDVKIDGKNACRLTDKLTMNHANTMCLGGWLQIPVIVGDTDEEKVACAIYCCDEMEYQQSQGDDPSRRCQRLATKKHSCVTHSLRVRKGGELTTTNKFTGIEAIPQFTVKGIDRTLIPDVKIGDRIIDAKFPCAKPVANLTKGGVHKSSATATAEDMITSKEETEYKKIKGVKSVEAMTPNEAKEKKNANCDCKVAEKRSVASVK